MKGLDRITLGPSVMGGTACVRGLRMTVGTTLGLPAARRSRRQIPGAYPYLEPEDVDQAIAHPFRRVEEREVPLTTA